MPEQLIVTIDGPSGTGKSTVSKLVADRLGVPHLETGSFYRAATLAVLRSGVDPSDGDAVRHVVATADLRRGAQGPMLDGEDVTDEIRSDDVTSHVSAVSAHPEVRKMLVNQQREWVESRNTGAVVEGRDIGTVVFPDARHKIYLDARPGVRAMRRALQDGDDPAEVLEDMSRRDHLDSTRKASPLTIPDDAHVIDTSDLTIEEVVDAVVEKVTVSG